MLQKLFRSSCLIALALWSTGIAHAIPIEDMEPETGPVYLHARKGPKTYDFNHEITGFMPGLHSITGATIEITFSDDALECCDSSENVNVTIGGTTWGTTYSYEDIDLDDIFNPVLNGAALAYLNDYGALPVLITATKGDLYFVSSVLTAEVLMPTPPPPDPSATPEPATWMLLGSGLVGIVGFGLKRRKLQDPA